MQTGRRRGPEPLVAQETRYLPVVAGCSKKRWRAAIATAQGKASRRALVALTFFSWRRNAMMLAFGV